MANQWLRLWHDMPTDPKWRTIARASKQPLPSVLGVYVHILVNVSVSANASERGRTQNLIAEDIASALDIETDAVEAILDAMQGRVMDGEVVSGWEKRQPLREDDSAARSRAYRELKRVEKESERNRTQPNAKKRPDKDTDTDKDKPPKPPAGADAAFDAFWAAYPRKDGKLAAHKAFGKALEVAGGDDPAALLVGAARAFAGASAGKDRQYLPHPTTWLNQGRWMDEKPNGPALSPEQVEKMQRFPGYVPQAAGGG